MQSRRPLWRDVYDAIKEAIDQRILQPGDQLASEDALAEQHDVSRVTVRRALTELESEGVLTEARGPRGRTVREFRPLYWHLSRFELGDRRDDPDTGTDEWAADMKAQGRVPRQIVSVTKLVAPNFIADGLEVPHGTVLVRRRRVRLADDVPVSIADTWLTEEMADRRITLDDGSVVQPWWYPDDLAVRGGIVRATGVVQSYALDTTYIRHATSEEAELLKINAATSPVGDHVRVGYDTDDTPVRVLRSVFPGDRLAIKHMLKYRNVEGNV